MTTYTRKVTGKTLKQRLAKLEAIEFANNIKDDIQENFDKSRNVDGSQMRPIASETIAIKKKRGGIAPTKPLVFKGGTKRGIQTKRISRTEAIVYETGNAKHYYGGGSTPSNKVLAFQKLQDRDPWGVSDRAVKKNRELVKKRLLG